MTRRLLVPLVSVVALAAALAAPSQAGTPAEDCAGDFNETQCVALASRLDTIIASNDLLVLRLETLRGIIENEPGDAGVALNAAATERLDLAWWGAWAVVGLLFALIVSPMMYRAFRWWRE